jgi:hypothetical protein
MEVTDCKTERDKDVENIKISKHPRKVIVAGPGTGKSFLFSELIKKKKDQGKNNFLAITFIGKLGDALADDLCGLSETMTLHGFARKFVLNYCKDWNYYPGVRKIIEEDLKSEGIDKFEIGDENYRKKTIYYKAVGDEDVVYYAIQICKKDSSKIPSYDLILVDEYQDFNELESELVDILAQKSEIVIVGDDDQALYGFKGSSPSFIRKKYDSTNKDWESRTLRFCSRCTNIIIKYFHAIVERFNLNNSEETDICKRRVEKEYICYAPDKNKDSIDNPKIHLIKNCPVGMIAYKIRSELEKIIANQKIKSVLVIGEGQSCASLLKTVAMQLKSYGFQNVDHKSKEDFLNVRQNIIDAYKFLSKDKNSLLAWRILGNPDEQDRKKHLKNVKTFCAIINGTLRSLENIKNSAIEDLESTIEGPLSSDKDIRKKVLFKRLRENNLYLSRPLGNLEITVCNILNSKGLGADIIFVIGFDQGRFPSKINPKDSEVYQMLVALTRAKKRVYLINTVGKQVSSFIEAIKNEDLFIEEFKPKT